MSELEAPSLPEIRAARERLGDVSTRLQENLSGVVVVKIFGREKQEAARFRRATEQQPEARRVEARTPRLRDEALDHVGPVLESRPAR